MAKMENQNRLLYTGLVVSIFLTPFIALAQYDGADYTQAYNVCSPVSHHLTKQQCNYGRVFEGYYVQCMYTQGYGDDNDSAENYYEGYLNAYNYCSSIADQNSKEYCSYGTVYNINYNKCMLKHGFNEHGEKVAQNKKPHFQFNF